MDVQNEGFTAFGQVLAGGMTVVNTIAALATCSDRPMVDYSSVQCSNGLVPGNENFVTIYSVEIIDPSATTADPLSKVENTLLTVSAPEPNSSGGSLAWLSLLSLGLLSLRRK